MVADEATRTGHQNLCLVSQSISLENCLAAS